MAKVWEIENERRPENARTGKRGRKALAADEVWSIQKPQRYSNFQQHKAYTAASVGEECIRVSDISVANWGSKCNMDLDLTWQKTQFQTMSIACKTQVFYDRHSAQGNCGMVWRNVVKIAASMGIHLIESWPQEAHSGMLQCNDDAVSTWFVSTETASSSGNGKISSPLTATENWRER